MRRIFVSDVLKFVGSFWGDQREYLTCEEHGGEFLWLENPEGVHDCPECGQQLRVHVPHSEELSLRWIVWLSSQKWIPQRYTVWPGIDKPSYKYWAFWDRQWRKRPYTDELFESLKEMEKESD